MQQLTQHEDELTIADLEALLSEPDIVLSDDETRRLFSGDMSVLTEVAARAQTEVQPCNQ